jgi:PhnB protein
MSVKHNALLRQLEQALEFYHSVFGGALVIATYADFGAPKETPNADKVVWRQVAADSGFRVIAYAE